MQIQVKYKNNAKTYCFDIIVTKYFNFLGFCCNSHNLLALSKSPKGTVALSGMISYGIFSHSNR